MFFQLRSFRTHGSIYVAYYISLRSYQRHRLPQQDFTIDVLELTGCIRKVVTDITHIGSTQQGIANGMYQYICIRMPQQAFLMFQTDATQPEFTAFHQAMNIKSKTNTNLHI